MITPDNITPEQLIELCCDLVSAMEHYKYFANTPDEFTPELLKEFEALYKDCQEYITAYEYYEAKAAPLFD